MPSPIIKGLTTIKWGTDGLVTNATGGFTGASAVVRSVRISGVNETFKYPDNNGFTKVWVGLQDGTKAEIECLFDTAITSWPEFGDKVDFKDPRLGAEAAALSGILEEDGVDFSQKEAGIVKLTVTKYAGIS